MSDLYYLCRIENYFFNFMFYILFIFTFSVIMSTVHIREGFSSYDFNLGSVTARKKFCLVRLRRFAKIGSDLIEKEREFYPNCRLFWFGFFQWSVIFENIPVALPTADLEKQVPLAEVIVTKQNLISFKVTM